MFRCFRHQFFIAIFRLCAILGVIETQLFSGLKLRVEQNRMPLSGFIIPHLKN